MSKQKNKNADPGPQGLWNYVLVVLVSVAAGAGLTLLITSQRSTPEVRSVSPASPLSAPPATAAMPMPDVTGLAPGDAAIVRGNAAYDLQRWPEAIRQYQLALASGLDTADLRTDLGNALRFSGQPEKALEQYTIAQKLNPMHENSLLNEIGLFIEVLHQPARAIPACEEFIRKFPTSNNIPAVNQQLARAKTPEALAPSDTEAARKALLRWLPDQQKSKP